MNEVWIDTDYEKLPHASMLKEVLEYLIAVTYPEHILKRRIELLTKTERAMCNKAWHQVMKNIEKIDTIISDRAERENDPWK